MVAAMQAQQQKLLETPQQVNNNHLPMVKDLLSPLRQGAVHRGKLEQVRQKASKSWPDIVWVIAAGKKS